MHGLGWPAGLAGPGGHPDQNVHTEARRASMHERFVRDTDREGLHMPL